MNRNLIMQDIEKSSQKTDKMPDFKIGDTVVVQTKIKEGDRERLQAFEGIVIAKRNRGFNSAFTVRKISHGEGVERSFQLHSPLIASIEIKRRGDVRKAKLYHLRALSGRAARIREKIKVKGLDSVIPEEKKLKVEEALPEETSSETKAE